MSNNIIIKESLDIENTDVGVLKIYEESQKARGRYSSCITEPLISI